MESLNIQLSQKKSPEQLVFEGLYKRKFVISSLEELSNKKRIIAKQEKSVKPELQENQELRTRPENRLKRKTMSVGSLTPKIKELQSIANSEKKKKEKNMAKSLSKLQIYFTSKNLKKEQQANLLFLTQGKSTRPQKYFLDKFNTFVSVNTANEPKNLRALLNLTEALEVSDEKRKQKIKAHKQNLKEIVTNMIEQHHHNQDLIIELEGEGEKQEKEEESSLQNDEEIGRKKDIGWVIGECKKYERKFRIKGKKKKKTSEKAN